VSIKTARDGRETGDWTLPELQLAASRGDLLPSDLVWVPGWAEWKTLSLAAGDLRISFGANSEAVGPSQLSPASRSAQKSKLRLVVRLFAATFMLLVGVKVCFYLYQQSESSAIEHASVSIKGDLKSPSSFSLISGQRLWTGENSTGNHAHVVRIEYDAQNGFGALIRGCSYVAATTFDTGFWEKIFSVSRFDGKAFVNSAQCKDLPDQEEKAILQMREMNQEQFIKAIDKKYWGR
jgi:hypothetical protein